MFLGRGKKEEKSWQLFPQAHFTYPLEKAILKIKNSRCKYETPITLI
jgi:hypothetical protein